MVIAIANFSAIHLYFGQTKHPNMSFFYVSLSQDLTCLQTNCSKMKMQSRRRDVEPGTDLRMEGIHKGDTLALCSFFQLPPERSNFSLVAHNEGALIQNLIPLGM